MIDSKLIENLVQEFLVEEARESLYLVDVIVRADNFINVELGDDEGLSLDLCIKMSKFIESKLDRDVEDFELEVGSAGLTSPFKIKRQYEGAIDTDVEVLVKGGVKEVGLLQAVTEDHIVLLVEKKVKLEGAKRKTLVEEELTIPYGDILQCKRQIKI